MQGNMAIAPKTRASRQAYTSTSQPTLPGFETPFEQKLSPTNRWVALCGKIPWDDLVKIYQKQMHNSQMGADGINPRVVLGAIIIKHMLDLSDRETILHIQENPYLQFFIGLSSFSNEEVFDPSLFVEFRKRLGANQLNEINETILRLSPGGPIGREPEPKPATETKQAETKPVESKPAQSVPPEKLKEQSISGHPAAASVVEQARTQEEEKKKEEKDKKEDAKEEKEVPKETCKGKMIIDATACPQDIRYPTDLDLLNDAREKSEELIDALYVPEENKTKPRTYREIAHEVYLKTAQKKTKTKKEIRRAVGRQLRFLKRNLAHIDFMLKDFNPVGVRIKDIKPLPLDIYQLKYLLVIRTVYDQQLSMFNENTHQIDHRIVSIHQPHVRPIVRGKTVAKTEFGAKIHVSLVNGITFLEDHSWEAFNESTRLMDAVERYKKRFGYYPKELLADKIYCTRENRKNLNSLGITLKAKPLGRPKAVEAHVSPGERNPIEGKFGQAKTAYGMNRIKSRLARTSESWVASIIMVLNLVKLAGQVPFYLWSATQGWYFREDRTCYNFFSINYFSIKVET